jgi:hypothetical protein
LDVSLSNCANDSAAAAIKLWNWIPVVIRGLLNHEAARREGSSWFAKPPLECNPKAALQNTTENMFQNIRRSAVLFLPIHDRLTARRYRYPDPANHRKGTLLRFQTCISCTPCAAASALHP